MQRGDIVLCSFSGDYGKVRPAVIVQNSVTLDHFDSITLCPITSDCKPVKLTRINLGIEPGTGLDRSSQIMVDKIMTVRKNRVVKHIGHLPEAVLHKLNDSLLIWLDLKSPLEK